MWLLATMKPWIFLALKAAWKLPFKKKKKKSRVDATQAIWTLGNSPWPQLSLTDTDSSSWLILEIFSLVWETLERRQLIGLPLTNFFFCSPHLLHLFISCSPVFEVSLLPLVFWVVALSKMSPSIKSPNGPRWVNAWKNNQLNVNP